MRSLILVIATAAVIAVVSSPSAQATIYDVCTSGCTYSSLVTALTAIDSDSTTADTITVSGTFVQAAAATWKIGVVMIGISNATITPVTRTMRCAALTNCGRSVVIKDITFNDFWAKTNSASVGNWGGCFRVRNSTAGNTCGARFEGCTFNNCDAGGVGGDADTGRGGALYVDAFAGRVELELVDCVFTDCSATYETASDCGGGAVFLQNDSELSVSGCTFGTAGHGNSVVGTVGGYNCAGGAIRCVTSVDADISDCTFTGNSAQYGGAVAVTTDDPGGYEFEVEECAFTSNSATQQGGALLYDCPTGFVGEWTIADCVFTGNSAVVYGGAIASGHSALTMDRCQFYTNTSADAGAFGVGGGIVSGIMPSLETYVNLCTFQDNGASSEGGAVYVGGGSVSAELYIDQSAFTDNDAAAGSGGTVFWEDPDITYTFTLGIDQTIIAHSTGYGIATNTASNSRLSYQFTCCDTIDLAPELLENTAGATSCADCIGDDPEWCTWTDDDTANDDFRLSGDSPCYAVPVCKFIGPYNWCDGDCGPNCWVPGGEADRRRPYIMR